LRPKDIDQAATPTLYGWANNGALAELVPTFPCVTSCVQASMWTGTPPAAHGVIANGFYDRDRRAVEFWVGRNDMIAGEQIWDAVCAARPSFTSAIWHGQNIKGASADSIVTPAPIHEPDGTMKLWCYSKPDGLYQRLLDELGHFPLQHYWGPIANIESTRWILNAANWLVEKDAPSLHWIYIPHLDYAAQKFGPNGAEERASLVEFDQELARFVGRVAESRIGDDVVYLVAGEYAMTDVTGVVYPNRALRKAGLLNTRVEEGKEYVDFAHTPAFAMVDHQLAHVYVNPSEPRASARASTQSQHRCAIPHGDIRKIADLFRDREGIAGVYAGDDRNIVGLNHERAGDIILVAEDTHWFAYYWWLDDAAAPPFARTVDIHNKPGYDPVELFFDPKTKGIPLDARLVKGSHGVPAKGPQHRTALICSSRSDAVVSGRTYRDTDIKRLTLELLNPGVGG
jgi:predicted AlkP superfamily pyrophosphatase or phosphodiesterase